jgi:hypothetical protein
MMEDTKRRRAMQAVVLLALAGCDDGAGTRIDEPAEFDPHFQLEERLAIGDEGTFGRISDLIADGSGHTYVLDRYLGKVDRFDSSGVHLATVGKEAEGPGEFSHPSALALWGEADLYVYDRSNLRLSRFATEDDALTLVEEVPVPFSAGDICTLGDRIFAMGLFEGYVVHELSSEGEVVASFGQAEGEDAVIQEYAYAGRLLCDEATATILAVPLKFPQVSAFAPSGELRWAVELTDYHKAVYERGPGDFMRPRRDASRKAHTAVGAVAVGPGVALVQMRLSSLEPTGLDYDLDGRLLSLADGTEIGRRSDLPRVGCVRDSVVYATVEDPYPRVLVMDMRSATRRRQ